MNRKVLLLAGTAALAVLLASCAPQGDASPSPSSPSPSVSAQDTQPPAPSGPAEVTTPSQQPSQEPSPGADSSPEPSAPDTEALKDAAVALIGSSVEELIAAIGEPISTDYAPSCLGSGEDGELVYDGFSVYTYREGSTETVKDVL